MRANVVNFATAKATVVETTSTKSKESVNAIVSVVEGESKD